MNVQPKKTREELIAIIQDISFQDRSFYIGEMGDGFFLQMSYIEADVETGKPEVQKTRKWYISPFSTTSEVVQTAFKCVMTSQEHIAREHFNYKGERVFNPHHDVEQLVELHRDARLKRDKRIPKPECLSPSCAGACVESIDPEIE